MKVIAIIPAYNEEKTITEVLKKASGFVSKVIVVDDGSLDRTARIARANGALVVSHSINRGLGAAIGTGFEAAKRFGADVVITLDADGQHDPSEIPSFLKAIESGADVVIGSRMIGNLPPSQGGIKGGCLDWCYDGGCLHVTGMPFHRRIAQLLGNLVTLILFGVWVTDSQSGFRAFTSYALSKIEIKTNRMEVSSELIAEARRNRLKLVEVPIKAIYTDYSLAKGQSFIVGLKTLIKLILRRITQ
jgi:glycosyltransferase involved in cell wall biosynthesis